MNQLTPGVGLKRYLPLLPSALTIATVIFTAGSIKHEVSATSRQLVAVQTQLNVLTEQLSTASAVNATQDSLLNQHELRLNVQSGRIQKAEDNILELWKQRKP